MTPQCLLMKTLFYIVLDSGRMVSEILAMFRLKNLLIFGVYPLWVKINPNPNFMAKNEIVEFRDNPMLIQSWKNSLLEYHPLYPVETYGISWYY